MSVETEDPVAVALEQFRVSDAIEDTFPEATVAVVVALGLSNGPSSAVSASALAAAAAALRATIDADRLRDHPKIACWHDIYKRFNAKPRKYPCSVESLARRALRPESAVPSINCLVDFYNALSLRHLVPIGGEDLDTLQGRLELRPATGRESFDIADDSTSDEVTVPEGEVVWTDDLGVTCRRWNWRQGRRTRLTESTQNAYFIIDAAAPSTGGNEIGQIVKELIHILQVQAQARHVGYRLIKLGNPPV
ncbi:B3/4 domain-containing protein [Paraburkholderia hospita]|uniref:B3/B4 domain-containing protein n=1 Tax=Paraburkholderia hospita TaxID=169430 RepID=UPI000DEFFE27|nr:phenylalanine--tRNA ligase beta subunit-related protein [Paraburkholderia hospita]AXF05913.1 cytoplasmic protein [Paraburkholderia hospita]